ncbi:GtrA family protein [bacterium]|nr:GtrA family protein [bacterium]
MKFINKNLNSLPQKHPLIWQITIFGIIGALNFGLDFLIYLSLTRFLAFHYLFANIIAFFIANISSFFLNKNYSFSDSEKTNLFKKYFKFMSFTVASLLISSITIFLFVRYFQNLDIHGKIIGTILGAIWNFITYKKLVFLQEKERNMV